ncbi:hypothetical protein AWZ03_004198 [Drosophila navojoa]|uniref:Tektin n=1 Tax=Drosophila navojoa TaxID=7232 RepID=A0A484BMR1_DRONA|nr:tektin-2-like [Drosophila navojoa]TDG49330.1 hypothetical protein AWZ03_004198 [Drosophila navojoa]
MAFHFISTMEKPMQHVSLFDWQGRLDRLRNVANARRADAVADRSSSRLLRNESRIEGEWANYGSNRALDLRIFEIKTWHELITKSFDRMMKEVDLLIKERAAAEADLQWQAGPVAVIRELLFIRDDRNASELSADSVSTELHNQFNILENNHQLLARLIHKAWEKLARLDVVRYKVEEELKNKMETIEIDSAQRSLTCKSNAISFKLDALRNPKESCSYENWLESIKQLKQMVDNEVEETVGIRESLYVCRNKALSMLKGQDQCTEFYIRNRVFQTQQAFNELNWQRSKLVEDIRALTSEIKDMEDALLQNTNALKLAETRLENRNQRNITELCLDEVYDSLCLEVEKLSEIRRCLMRKLDESKANLNLLSDHTKKIDLDIGKKEHSIMIDTKALEVCKEFKLKDAGIAKHNPFAQTDLNIELTHAEDITEKN